MGGVIGKFDVSRFDNNYLRRRAIINCLDYILRAFFRTSAAERNGTTSDKEHNGKLDADRPLPRRRTDHRVRAKYGVPETMHGTHNDWVNGKGNVQTRRCESEMRERYALGERRDDSGLT